MSRTKQSRSGQRVELAVGIFLFLAFATLLILAFASTNGNVGFGASNYRLTAKFGNIGELRVHAPVKIAGVVIGEVSRVALDPKTYSAVVTLALQPAYKNMPADTSAKILTAGLLGDRYIALEPGGEAETLPSGGELIYTQNAIVLEEMIGKYVFGAGAKKDLLPASDVPPASQSNVRDATRAPSSPAPKEKSP